MQPPPASEAAAPPGEPQLIKAHSAEPAPPLSGNGAAVPNGESRPEPERRPEPALRNGNGHARPDDHRQPGNGLAAMRPVRPGPAPQPPSPFAAESRRTLHLSLDGSSANGHGPSPAAERPFPATAEPPPHPANSGERGDSLQAPGAPRDIRYREPPRQGFPPAAPARAAAEEPGRFDPEASRRKEASGSFIDRELRARVDGDIAAFLAAFDAALADDTPEIRTTLREATDRLLRAGARTRIELERLEARVPLSPRDGRSEPNRPYR